MSKKSSQNNSKNNSRTQSPDRSGENHDRSGGALSNYLPGIVESPFASPFTTPVVQAKFNHKPQVPKFSTSDPIPIPKTPDKPTPPRTPNKATPPNKITDTIKSICSSPDGFKPFKGEEDTKPLKPPVSRHNRQSTTLEHLDFRNRSEQDTEHSKLPNKSKRYSTGMDLTKQKIEAAKNNIEDGRAAKIIKKIHEGGNPNVIKALITNQNINYQDNEGNTFLMHAISKENSILVGTLLEYDKLDVNLQNNRGNTALMMAIMSKNYHPAIVTPLLQSKIDLNLVNSRKECALFLAIKQKNFDLVKLIIEQGANFNLPMGKKTLFLKAVKNDNQELVELILQRQDHLTGKDAQKFEAFLTSSQKGLEKMVAILIKYNCSMPKEIDAHLFNPHIKHLIKIGKFVDESYASLVPTDPVKGKLNITKDDYELFCSRLLLKVKDEGGSGGFNSAQAFWQAYLGKYKILFLALKEGKEFVDYLEKQIQAACTEGVICKVDLQKLMNLKEPGNEILAISARKKFDQFEQVKEFSKLLGDLEKDPYNGEALKKLNVALIDEKAILSFVKKFPVIGTELKKVNETYIEKGMLIIKLNDLINKEIPKEPNTIQLITEEEINPYNNDLSTKLIGDNAEYSISDN